MVLESLGRVGYVLVILLAEMYADGEVMLYFPMSVLGTCAAVQVGMYGIDYYSRSVAMEYAGKLGQVMLIVGVCSYVVSLYCVMGVVQHTDFVWSTLLSYVLYVFFSVLYGYFNIKGGGSVFVFFTAGVFAVQFLTLSLNIGWSLQVLLLCIPANLLLQSSLVVKELALQPHRNITTTAGLLGKHGSFRFVVLMHGFTYFLVLVDTASISIYRGLPLVLCLWSLVVFYYLRIGDFAGLGKSSYRLFLTFTLLTAVGIMMESDHFASDMQTKYHSTVSSYT